MHCCPRPKAEGNSASGHPQHLVGDKFDCCTERYEIVVYYETMQIGMKMNLNKMFNPSIFDALRCCHISPDSVNGRRTDRKSIKNVYPVVKVVSVAMKVVAECVKSA